MQKYVVRREFKTYRKFASRATKLRDREVDGRLLELTAEHATNIQKWLTSVHQDLFREVIKTIDVKISVLQQKEDERTGRTALFRILASAGALSLLGQILHLLGFIKI